MRVLVTGAKGFIGKKLVAHLESRGLEVFRLYREEIDGRHYDNVLRFVDHIKPEQIYHLAARTGGVTYAQQDPMGIYVDNILLGFNMIRAARALEVPKVLVTLSSCGYADSKDTLVEQEYGFQPAQQTRPIGAAKAAICEQGKIASKDGKTKVVSVILNTVYGPGAPYEGDRAKFIMAMINRAYIAHISGNNKLAVFGKTGVRRTVTYIDDVVEMLPQIMKYYNDTESPLNLALGEELTMGEFAETIADIVWAGQKHSIEFIKDPQYEGVARKHLDRFNFQQFLNRNHIYPTETKFEAGVISTLEWIERSQFKTCESSSRA